MRRACFLVFGALALAGCGEAAPQPPPGTPPPGLQKALDEFEATVKDAAQNRPQPGPGFKVSPSCLSVSCVYSSTKFRTGNFACALTVPSSITFVADTTRSRNARTNAS